MSYTIPRGGWNARFGPQETDVVCPSCKKGTLKSQFSCMQANFVCSNCHVPFDPSELAKVLSDTDFETLADVLGNRFSNRV